jgi:uncharacterized membrane protein
MIEQRASPSGAGVEFRLRPNRSVSARGLAAFIAALVLTSILVAVQSAWQGNVFAPWFALLEAPVVALCLWLAWRKLGREQRIAVTPQGVVVRDGAGPVRFDPYWVRVEHREGRTGRARERLVLTSHGKAVEIGAFLGDEERAELEAQLKSALAEVRGDQAA